MGLFDTIDGLTDVKSRDEFIKSPFRYPGNKQKSLQHILPMLPYGKKYIEVFGGSGAVLINRNRSKIEVFNDINSGIAAFYTCLGDSTLLAKLKCQLDATVWSRENFVWCRDTWNDCNDIVDRATRWYYMLNLSFGGLGRNFGRATDSGGDLIGAMKRRFPDFHKIHDRLQGVIIENVDWRICIDDYDSHDAVFYLDPPYTNTDNGTYNGSKNFDHEEFLSRVSSIEGFVAVSGYDSPLYLQQDFWDEVIKWEVYSSMNAINANGNNRDAGVSKRGKVREFLYVKSSS